MDFVDNRARIPHEIAAHITYKQERVTPESYEKILNENVADGDMIIDLAWNIDTIPLLKWCYDHKVRYVNSSIEQWDPYKHAEERPAQDFTLYVRHQALNKFIQSLPNNHGATAILDHGANPGLVSHLTKQALIDIATKIIHEKPHDPRITHLKKAIVQHDFATLAHLCGVKTIQIAERDSQRTAWPKKMNEFVNSWSIAGLHEEALAPAELGWGTHEKSDTLPNIRFHQTGPKNQVCFTTRGMDTLVRSWVPSGDIVGMVIRHGEAYSISDRLTVWHNGVAAYRPTVYYAYCINDSALASLYELRMRQFELQPVLRMMNDDIIDGADELGCFLLGHDFNAWWIGSVLTIDESRTFVPHQSATTLQVAISVVAAVRYALHHPHEGICLPDDIDYREILEFAKPYLGTFISMPVNWSPLTRKSSYVTYQPEARDKNNEWQFSNFMVTT